MNARGWLVALVLGLCVVSALPWLHTSRSGSSQSTGARTAPLRADGGERFEWGRTGIADATVTQLRAAAPRDADPARAAYVSGDYATLLDEHRRRPHDATVLVLTALATRACDATRNHLGESAAAQPFALARTPANSPRREAMAELVRRCLPLLSAGLAPPDLIRAAAANGNASARWLLLDEQHGLERQMRGPGASDRVSEAGLAQMRELLPSLEGAALAATTLLARQLRAMARSEVDDDAAQRYDALVPALTLLACDLGNACVANSSPSLIDCALLARCSALDKEQSLQHFTLSPAQYSWAQSERTRLRDALNAQRWRALGIAPGMGHSAPVSAP